MNIVYLPGYSWYWSVTIFIFHHLTEGFETACFCVVLLELAFVLILCVFWSYFWTLAARFVASFRFSWYRLSWILNQHTREIISAPKMSHKHDKKDLSRLRSLSPGVRVNSRYINSTTGTSSTLERRSARISSSLDGLLNSTPATSLVFCPGRALHLLTTHVWSLREKKRGRQRDRQEERERETETER